MSIGQKVKKQRLEIKASQGELAADAGVSQGYLSQVESSSVTSISLDIAFRLSDALGVTIYDLIDEKHLKIKIIPELEKKLTAMSIDKQRRLLEFLNGQSLEQGRRCDYLCSESRN